MLQRADVITGLLLLLLTRRVSSAEAAAALYDGGSATAQASKRLENRSNGEHDLKQVRYTHGSGP